MKEVNNEPLKPSEQAPRLLLEEVHADDQESVDPILRESGVISNFTCFPQLYAFLGKPANHIYICRFKDKERLLLHRTADISDVRILFSRETNDNVLIEAIKEHFQPRYLAYNLIPDKPTDLPSVAKREDLVVDVDTIADLCDSTVRADFNKCQRRHPDLVYVRAALEYKPRTETFLDNWCRMASKKFGTRITGESDRRFINLFLDTAEVQGGVVLDGDKIVGITFHTHHSSDPKLAVNVILKNLRGYQRLGQWLTVQHARQLQEEGFKEVLIGGTEIPSQAHFKRKFMKNGRVNTCYSGELYSDPDFAKTSNYLRDFWT